MGRLLGGGRLLCEGNDVAAVELARSPLQRMRGLLGRSELHGGLLLTPARSIHTLGMRFAIDVAHLDAHLGVLAVTTMAPNRVGRVVRRARHVLETPAGACRSWGIVVGARLDVLETGAQAA